MKPGGQCNRDKQLHLLEGKIRNEAIADTTQLSRERQNTHKPSHPCYYHQITAVCCQPVLFNSRLISLGCSVVRQSGYESMQTSFYDAVCQSSALIEYCTLTMFPPGCQSYICFSSGKGFFLQCLPGKGQHTTEMHCRHRPQTSSSSQYLTRWT